MNGPQDINFCQAEEKVMEVFSPKAPQNNAPAEHKEKIINENGSSCFTIFNHIWQVEKESKDNDDLRTRINSLCQASQTSLDKLLFQAIKTKLAYRQVTSLINAGATCNELFDDGTALMHAIEMGRTESALKLLKDCKLLNVNTASSQGRTALTIAIRKGNYTVAEELTKKGATISNIDRLLFEAIKTRQAYNQIYSLIVSGATCNQTFNGITTLMQAIQMERVDDARTLIKKCSPLNLNALSVHGQTALMIAAKKGNLRVVETLIDRGAEMATEDKNGDNAYQIALQYNHLDVAQYLLKQDETLAQSNEETIWEELDDEENSELMYGAKIGNLEQVKHQVGINANLERTNKRGETAFYLACSEGKVEVVDFLLSQDLISNCLNWEDHLGKTPLLAAASEGHLEVVKALLKEEEIASNLNQADKQGITALSSAAFNGHTAVVRRLLSENNILESLNKMLPKSNEAFMNAPWYQHEGVRQLIESKMKLSLL